MAAARRRQPRSRSSARRTWTSAASPLAAVHVQRVEKDTATDGTALSTTDQWLDPRSGLVLREVASSSSTTASPIGDVHYTEQYELTLTSLTPQH